MRFDGELRRRRHRQGSLAKLDHRRRRSQPGRAKGKPTVGLEGSYKFGFDPLFGIELRFDILSWLIRFAGGLGGLPGELLAQALVQMLKRFAKKWKGDEDSWAQATLDIGMYFTTGGDIKGSLGFKYVDGKCEVDASASKIGGGVDFNVEGHIKAKARAGRYFRVEAAGTGQVGLGASEDPDKKPCRMEADLVPKVTKNGFAYKGQLTFSGLAFYYLLYVEAGAGAGDSEGERKRMTVYSTGRAASLVRSSTRKEPSSCWSRTPGRKSNRQGQSLKGGAASGTW